MEEKPAVDMNVVNLIRQKKKTRQKKTDMLKRYENELKTLRYEYSFSLADICAYLETKYGIKTTPETLIKAFPEFSTNLEKLKKKIKKLSNNELLKLLKIVKNEIANRGITDQQ